MSDGAMDACIAALTTLNKIAAEVMRDFDIHAVTDITGFGLAGHAFEMASGSDVCLAIRMEGIPILSEALDMYRKGVTTAVNIHNRQMVAAHMRFDADLPAWHQEIVFDPQTSGGLMVSLPEDQGRRLLDRLKDAGVSHAAIIGNVVSRKESLFLIFQ